MAKMGARRMVTSSPTTTTVDTPTSLRKRHHAGILLLTKSLKTMVVILPLSSRSVPLAKWFWRLT